MRRLVRLLPQSHHFCPNLMAHRQRRLFFSDSDCSSDTTTHCYSSPRPNSQFYYFSPTPQPSPSSSPPPPPLPPPLPLPPPPPPITKVLHSSSKNLVLIAVLLLCALTVAFLFLSYLTVRKRRNSRAGTSRRRRPPTNEEMENSANLDLDLLDGNHGGAALDHPIWYIRTVGLQQSVIESIAIFKYKRGESPIEGTDCSVCLSEFEEDEELRLLPKCSHAFHIHCIDTWLSSHQNCPLCRAPIVSAVSVADVPNSTVITISDQAQLDDASTVHPDPESLMNSHSQQFDHVFPDEVNTRLPVDQFSVEEEEEEEDQDRVSRVSVHTNLRQGRNSGTRVLSDLGDHRRSVLKEEEEEEEEEECVGRRSVSMDASSAAHLTSSFLAMLKADGEGCSSNEAAAAAALKNNSKKKKKTMKSNSLVMDCNEEGDRSITSRVTKTYSLGRFLQRGGAPVHGADLKRSTSSASACASSSGGFFSLSSRH